MGSSLQTHLLSYWVRGPAGLHARGGGAQADLRQRLRVGPERSRPRARGLRGGSRRVRRARVRPAMPSVETDLPGGARRLVRKRRASPPSWSTAR
jgi:hypothetical protein